MGRGTIDHLIPLVPEWSEIADESLRQNILNGRQPVVIRGLVKHWRLVTCAAEGMDSLAAYLLAFDQGASFQAMISPASAEGRLFYTPDLQKFNFDRMNGDLAEAMKILKALAGRSPCPGFYIGSKNVKEYLPGLERETFLDLVAGLADPNIWMGNAVTVATHNDDSENIACVAAGYRRFTLFPPDQLSNLYIGPKDMTPAGRPISLVDLNAPDYGQFPLFREALQHAQVAELYPGDALYIPTNWWHNVESLGDFNILINYWWKGDPPPLHKVP